MSLMFALREAEPAELPPGTRLLNGLYQIVEPLQKGGFAMTYVARDSLERHVVIKECFPAGICERADGLVRAVSPAVEAQFANLKQQFLREARGVATLKHPYVVAVHQVFEENNTAYMALDYVAGMDLISVLEDEPERLTAEFLEATLRETLKAVRHIHANGILHRDIAPDNIRVDAADRITLIDFGAAGARNPSQAVAQGSVTAVKDGYSPPEFYGAGEVQDFSSDLYSLGATFHHLITGEPPVDGQSRRAAISSGSPDPYVSLAQGEWKCSYPVLLTVDRALDIARERRPQSADLWLQALDEMPKTRPAQPCKPVADRNLDAAISRLVQDVNKTIASPVMALQRKASRPKSRQGAPKPKVWVDIVGNPISDIATWVQQQELNLQPAAVAVPSTGLVSDTVQEVLAEPEFVPLPTAQKPLPPRKSFIAGLLARCLSRSPETCPT